MASTHPFPFLKLLPELRNRIYASFLSTSTNIAIWYNKTTRKLEPAVPPIAYVNREIYNEFPLRNYYANSTFVLAENVCNKPMIDKLIETRGPLAREIQRVKFSFVTGVYDTLVRGTLPARSEIRITATRDCSGKAVVADAKVLRKGVSVMRAFHPRRTICHCGLTQIAEQSSVETSLLEVVGALIEYVRMHRLLDHVCEGCGALRGSENKSLVVVLEDGSGRFEAWQKRYERGY
ncbi:hypothetical protein LTR62_008167 [Meristemomyces frigidus]|uniref:Uncharacterized protein n=1 Tax=Meristemomyces frigidus TaxID=1508187 RepID=A0AAN7YD22_9PEZI|nr:hypothetical protein LTR62_008167 [Meristemomyces frigidus]